MKIIRKKIWNVLNVKERNKIRNIYKKSKNLYNEKHDEYSHGELNTFIYVFGEENLTSKYEIEKNYSVKELFDQMNECFKTGNHKTVIIVYSSDNWPNENHSLESRSYESYSDQWGWDYSKEGRCRLGSSLDGIDKDIRLDTYDWKIEYWY